MRVLLLNPPGERLFIRDLYCSITSKGDYYWQPADLVVLSGILAEGREVVVLDAMAARLGREDALARAVAARPDAIISLTGSASWGGDLAFLTELKALLPTARIAICGDVVVGRSEEILRDCAIIDASITDFTSSDVGVFADGASGGRALAGVWHRWDGKVIGPAPRGGQSARSFRVPRPRHDLFELPLYRLPYASRRPVATVLTSYACPFTCTFCIQSALVMDYKARPVDDVIDELRELKVLGVQEVLFRDPTFEADRARALGLCRALTNAGLELRWSCNSRVDGLDEELIGAMAAAGCRTVLLGFETADDAALRRVQKDTTQAQAFVATESLRRHGIGVCGYFIIGLPGETRESAVRTIERAVELDLDYAAFAVPSPDYGTPLRAEAERKGWISPGVTSFDRSEGTLFHDRLSPREIRALMKWAYLRFYLRPRWLAREFSRLNAPARAIDAARNGFRLARRMLSP